MNAAIKFQAELQTLMAKYYSQTLSERIKAGIKAAKIRKASKK